MVRAATCPICRRPLTRIDDKLPTTQPFCSERCRQVDLFRWSTGKYAIVEELEPEKLAEAMLEQEELPEE